MVVVVVFAVVVVNVVAVAAVVGVVADSPTTLQGAREGGALEKSSAETLFFLWETTLIGITRELDILTILPFVLYCFVWFGSSLLFCLFVFGVYLLVTVLFLFLFFLFSFLAGKT